MTEAAARLAEERLLPDEEVVTEQFIHFLKTASARRYPDGVMRRFNQPRHAGCVEARFTIPDALPATLRVGLFASTATYRARVRFASASSETDRERDIRGMSIKVYGVDAENLTPGETTQDFILNSHPVMVAPDTSEFLALLRANEAGGLRRIWYFLRHLRSARIGMAARRHISCHLDIAYWSTTPFLFGDRRAVKYMVLPNSPRTSDPPGRRTDDYLRGALRRHLQEAHASFDFMVQFQTDPITMPIEDATQPWDPHVSPFYTVARLHIPRQDVETEEHRVWCEAAAFNPWHCHPAHRPLGNMNRARRRIYTELAAFRAARNSPVPPSPSPALEAHMPRVPWYRFPVLVSLIKLFGFRVELRQKNLHNTQPDMPITGDPDKVTPPATERQRQARTVEGTHNDLGVPKMGSVGQRFGRNVPLSEAQPDPHLEDPNPRVISNRLLARTEFVPATIVNLLAAAWIQFEIHDWMTHGKNEKQNPFTVPVDDADPWPGPRPMEIRRTRIDKTRTPDEQHLPPTYTNAETHWWDGSQVYGSRPPIAEAVRAHVDGKLAIGDDGLLPLDPDKGVDRTGVNDNWWVGLSLLHTLFTLEHNAICDALQDEHPDWSDDRLYDVARLINAALMAKIHTVEWTPAILPNPRMKVAMEANWWGLKGKSVMTSLLSRSDLVSGIVGSRADHHTAPYAITEEFTAVYRMHPLLPDELSFHSSETGAVIPGKERVPFLEAAERKTRDLLHEVSMQDVFYSFGISHPGAIQLRNYPNWLRKHRRPDGRLVDVAAIDVLRDRERGVPRYNRFRELLHMPRVQSFEELTDNQDWADALRDVYGGDIDKVDAQVGMLAEKLPDGFGFSDTAFRVFILMASRRLQSDRFLTDDYRPEVYTTLGIAWVEDTTMTDVILRHFPALKTVLRSDADAFRPWNDPNNILTFRD